MPLMLADVDDGVFIVLGLSVTLGGFYMIWACWRVWMDSRRRTRIAELQADAADNEARLKALMIQRGMAADEISRVLSSGTAHAAIKDLDDERGNAEDRIVKVLADNGYEGSDVERVLKAARVNGAIGIDAAVLVERLAGNWSKAADIERVLQSRPRPAVG